MIDVVCACGAKGRAPAELAGKKVRCKKCGEPIRIPPVEAGVPADFYDIAEPAPPRVPAAPPPPVASAQAPARRAPVERADRSFWANLAMSFVFMFRPQNVLMFIGAAVLALIAEFMFVPFLGLVPFGLLCALYLSTVTETAGGSDDLPNSSDFDGLWESVILPLVRFVGVSVILGAVGIVIIVAATSQIEDEDTSDTVALAIVAGVAFLWPMAVLMVALEGVLALFRIDLMLRAIVAVIVPYLAVWVALLVVLAIVVAPAFLMRAEEASSAVDVFANAPQRAVVAIVGVYTSLASMRSVGLLYRHYSDRFPWTAG